LRRWNPTLLALALAASVAGCPTDLAGVGAIEDLRIDDNPHSTISCWVRWTSAEPTLGRVEFGADGTRTHFREEQGATTDHEVLVVGMRPDTRYSLRAVELDPDTGEELAGAETSYDTGAPPFADLITELTEYDPARLQPGWTLTNITVDTVFSPSYAVALDEEAQVVWYWGFGLDEGRIDIEITALDDRVLIGAGVPSGRRPLEVGWDGSVLWEGPEQVELTEFLTPGEMHHRFDKLSDGRYMALSYQVREADGPDQGYDRVEVLDADGTATWTWDSIDHLPTPEDYVWGNAVLLEEEADAFYFNSRNFNALYRLDRESGDILWTFGEGADFAPDPDAAYPFQTQAHAPEFQSDGSLLIYDNGGMERGWSRVVEFALDTDAMTSQIVWEYPGDIADDEWFNFAMGDADRQPNGNTLITAGALIESNSRSRIFEVTAEGDRVWEVQFHGADDTLAAPYMADRIPPLAHTLTIPLN
jgi:hypothetical protein